MKSSLILEVNSPFLRSGFNYNGDAVSLETALVCPEATLTKQSFADECDINTIVRKFLKTGILPQDVGEGIFADVSGIANLSATESTNTTNIALAQGAEAFTDKESSTAYQRAMDDMKKAGLNPMLAFQQGGASTPSGAQAQVESASKTGLASTALSAYTGISAVNNQARAVQTAQSQAESTIALQGAQSAQAVAQTEKTQAETAKTIDSIKNQGAQRKLLENQAKLEQVKTSAAELIS